MKVYIVDKFNKFRKEDREHACEIFQMHGEDWAILEFEWDGHLKRDVHFDDEYTNFYLYNQLDDAREYVARIKSVNLC